MPYVNELVPDVDIIDHDLKALRRRYACLDFGFQWTVDRARGSYLMEMRSNPQDPTMREFVFHWDGQLGDELLQLKTLSCDDTQRHLVWRRLAQQTQATTPEDNQRHQARMAALKEALTVFRCDGLYSAAPMTYVVDFDF